MIQTQRLQLTSHARPHGTEAPAAMTYNNHTLIWSFVKTDVYEEHYLLRQGEMQHYRKENLIKIW